MMSFDEILKINSGLRDDHWEEQFFKAIENTKVCLLDENVQIGPDGWPYLFITNDLSINSKSEDYSTNVIQWAYENGIGLVVNPNKEKPDYILHYGMIWNYVHNKFFINDKIVETPPNAPIYISQVSEDILPTHPLNFIKDYIKSAGIDEPRGALISRDKINYEFALSIESLGNPPQQEHEGVARGIGWFMPNHIPVVLIYEEKLQKLFKL